MVGRVVGGAADQGVGTGRHPQRLGDLVKQCAGLGAVRRWANDELSWRSARARTSGSFIKYSDCIATAVFIRLGQLGVNEFRSINVG